LGVQDFVRSIRQGQDCKLMAKNRDKMLSSRDNEIRQAGEDAVWWDRVGTALGLSLYGWTYRNSASFVDQKYPNKRTHHIEDPDLAQRIIDLYEDAQKYRDLRDS